MAGLVTGFGGRSRRCLVAPLAVAVLTLTYPISAAEDPSAQLERLRASVTEVQAQRESLLRRLDSIDKAVSPAKNPKIPHRKVTDEDRAFWSFQPLKRVDPPAMRNSSWSTTLIDTFIGAALEAKGIAPSPQVSPGKLVRRLYYDLIGLPPSPEEIEAFERDPSPEAYEKLVDHLLASPHFGERWGRHWLDVARYADSDGYEFDIERPNAYHYRDFVIRAFNDDLPFDTFVKWQLAGDECAPENPLALAATGFCTSGPTVSNQELELNKYDEWDDMLSTTSVAFLGMTVACARCHDHKYDPISSHDYYRMLSAFTSTKRYEALMAPRAEADAYRVKVAEWEGRNAEAHAALQAIYSPVRDQLRIARIDALRATDDEKSLLKLAKDDTNESQKKLLAKHAEALKVPDEEIRTQLDAESIAKADAALASIAAIEIEKPVSPPLALALTDAKPEPADSYFLARGNPDAKQEKVALGFLSVLPGSEDDRFAPATLRTADAKTTFRRAALAEWLTDVDRGAGRLTARVIVNRVWNHYFGHGIVRTPNDFGRQGDRPSHPELLDWLAAELVQNGWSLKHIHKLILMSAVYQQSSEYDETAAAIDPDNRLLWRQNPKRLEAEIIRDATLAITNCLNPRMYGPGVFPFMPPDAVATGSTPKWPLDAKDGPDTWRRSIYIFVRRSARMPMIESFDAPDTVVSCGRRLATVTPTQSLSMMNSAFSSDQARFFADRLRAEAGDNREGWVRRAFAFALNRPPTDHELALSLGFLEKQVQRHIKQEADETKTNYYALKDKDVVQSALVDFAQVILSLNEFVYVD
ncbi:MAG: DUF1553 domain-containing protein [Candidatus Hydrogenedentes bacterium]|nr:DUF1553 domain-containing protein [Candidatus Hydrogenedentota bacterium]